MANDVVKSEGGAVAAPIANAGHLRATAARLYRDIVRENGVDRLPALPSAELRRELEQRRIALVSRLRPISMAKGEQDRARGAILLFLDGYANAKTSDPDGRSRSYVAMLMDQPISAILEAIDDFRNRRVFDIGKDGERLPFTIDHAPSAPRLLDQTKLRAADVQEEQAHIVRVLAVTKTIDGPAIDPAERARVAELMAGLAAGMTRKVSVERAENRRQVVSEAQAARDRAARIKEDARRRRAEDARATG